jgi:hypothetical protein
MAMFLFQDLGLIRTYLASNGTGSSVNLSLSESRTPWKILKKCVTYVARVGVCLYFQVARCVFRLIKYRVIIAIMDLIACDIFLRFFVTN